MSVLQTSGSVLRVGLTNWIPFVSFCLKEEKAAKGASEGKRSLPVGSTSSMTPQACSCNSQTSTQGFLE